MTQNYNNHDMRAIMMKVSSAFIALRDGSNSTADFNTLASILNIGSIRAETVGRDAVQVFDEAKTALMEADAIYESLRCYIFTPGQLVSLAKAVQGYSELLKMSTPAQMEEAGNESERRKAAGGVMKHPTKH